MTQQISLTSDVENLHLMEPAREINGQPVQTYHSPEVVDMGKASELLQGGSSHGMDNSYQTQW